jgi:hypothetical protein
MRLSRITALASAPLLLCSVAAAEEKAPQDEPRHYRSAEILLHMDEPQRDESWFSRRLGQFEIRHKALAYSQSLSFGDRQLEFSVLIPRIKKRRYGVLFELRY